MGSRAGEARAAHTKTGRKDGDGRVIYRASGGGEVVRRMVSSGAKKGTMAWRKPTPGGSQRGGENRGCMLIPVHTLMLRHTDGRVVYMYSSSSLIADTLYMGQYETSWIWSIPAALPWRYGFRFAAPSPGPTIVDDWIVAMYPRWADRTVANNRQTLENFQGRVVCNDALIRELWPPPPGVVYDDAPTQPP